MTNSRPGGVSAEDLGSAVRVHLDRVHDAVRRLGCEPDAAVEVVEVSAVDLVEAIADRPHTVPDAVGWWFRRAVELGRERATRKPDDLPLGGGVLSADIDQQVLAQALDQLPDRERMALLLRDSYDLPAATVGAALGLDANGATELVGRARLAFLPLVGEPAEPPDAPQRTHTLLTGLTVAALSESDRADVLARLEAVAFGILPSSAALSLPGQVEDMDDDDEPRLFSPLLVLLALVLVGMGGLGLGLVLGLGDDDEPTPISPAGQLDALISPPPEEPEVLISPPVVEAPAPATSVFVIPSPSPSPVSPPPPPPPPPVKLSIAVEPSSGGNGAELQVTGLGWPAGVTVTLNYLDTAGKETGSRTTVVVDGAGEFSAELLAEDPADLPGRHSVLATDGTRTLQAPYEVEP